MLLEIAADIGEDSPDTGEVEGVGWQTV